MRRPGHLFANPYLLDYGRHCIAATIVMVIGGITGAVIGKVGTHPILVTLAMMTFLQQSI
ncbi:MAG: hypothetical protein ACR2PT_20025 [Endozoicomonas sp.]